MTSKVVYTFAMYTCMYIIFGPKYLSMVWLYINNLILQQYCSIVSLLKRNCMFAPVIYIIWTQYFVIG